MSAVLYTLYYHSQLLYNITELNWTYQPRWWCQVLFSPFLWWRRAMASIQQSPSAQESREVKSEKDSRNGWVLTTHCVARQRQGRMKRFTSPPPLGLTPTLILCASKKLCSLPVICVRHVCPHAMLRVVDATTQLNSGYRHYPYHYFNRHPMLWLCYMAPPAPT